MFYVLHVNVSLSVCVADGSISVAVALLTPTWRTTPTTTSTLRRRRGSCPPTVRPSHSRRRSGALSLVAPSLSHSLARALLRPPAGRGPARRRRVASVCQVAMIECSSAIIAHINHHPLKRVNNILPSSLALATRSWRWGRARAGQARPGQAAGGSRRRYTKRVDCMTAREGMDDGRKTVMDICFETGKRHFTHGNGL